MAVSHRLLSSPIEGEVRFGGQGEGSKNRTPGILYVPAPAIGIANSSKPDYNRGSLLALDQQILGSVVTYYLGVDEMGRLRIYSEYPTNTNTEGTVVGGQTA